MILLVHILIALSSVAYTTYVFFKPSEYKLITSYILILSTLVSGFGLVIINPSHMVQACVSGLVYTAGMFVAIFAVHRKLARVLAKNDKD